MRTEPIREKAEVEKEDKEGRQQRGGQTEKRKKSELKENPERLVIVSQNQESKYNWCIVLLVCEYNTLLQ